MNIVLIGFSGTGKSHWSHKLEKERGFKRLCVDDLIAKRLSSLVPGGLADIEAVSDWMGQPHETRYAQNVKLYLRAESQITEAFLQGELSNPHQDSVLDTTGSVIYLGEPITSRLAEFGKVVYLEATQEVLDEMFRVFLTEPKPIMWGDAFSRREGESVTEAYRRSYPQLLRYRKGQYEKLAQISLNYHLLRSEGFGVKEFLAEIEKS